MTRGEIEERSAASSPDPLPSREVAASDASAEWGIQFSAYSGPVPPPRLAREWEELVPGAAKEILHCATSQVAHRIEIEKIAVRAGAENERLAIRTAFGIGIASIAGAVLLGLQGNTAAAIGVVGVQSVGLAIATIGAAASQRAERLRKFRAMERLRRPDSDPGSSR